MRVDLAPGWQTELDHGPEWLIVKLYGPHGDEAEAEGMAESLEMMMQQAFAHRLILELHELKFLPRDLVVELARLQQILSSSNRYLRLCGLSEKNLAALHDHQEDQCAAPPIPHFDNRQHALLGWYRPTKPR